MTMAASSDPIPLVIHDSGIPFRAQLEARNHIPGTAHDDDPALDEIGENAATTAVMSPRARVGMALAALALLTVGIVTPTLLGGDPPPEPSSSPHPLTSVTPATSDQRLEEPLDLSPLFAEGFLRHTRSGREHEAKLASALTAPVNIVNLWATWCEPCRREMPALGALLRTHPAVNLITLRVLDSSPWSEAPLSDLPPSTHVFSEPSALSRALRALGAIGRSVPITLVVDCRERLHWHHTGELNDETLAKLAATLDELDELSIDCPRRPRSEKPRPDRPAASYPQEAIDTTFSTTSTTEPTTDIPEPTSDETTSAEPEEYLAPRPPNSACGDGHCRPRRGENCYACPDDCGCKNGYHCAATWSPNSRRGEEWQCEPNTDVNLLRD